ncbi:MAG: endonuclease MutS2 [Clostridia bacterium]|nr:endonuclease MutS2 [Clostridia bacterium]
MSKFNKAIKTLEFDKVTELLADCARTEGAKALARTLTPESDTVRVEKLQADTDAAKFLIAKKGNPSFGDVLDISDAVERAQKKATLIPKELLDIANVMRTARLLADYSNDESAGETALTPVFGRLTVNRFLEERITRAIISEDMIADEASPALSDIRRKMRVAQGKVRETLAKFVSGSFGKYLQENIVTVRNGRYVVPVKVEYKNEVKGFVHDTSATGATVFIEPYAVLEANNELKELEIKENREIERVLRELSAECATFGGTIYLNYLNITQLALIFAKAELAIRMDACRPEINTEGRRRVRYIGARHPLIDPKDVVKVNISLGAEFDTMIITGPNTGGKTVALKTLGLFSIMAQSGLQLPCDSAEISMFDDVLADIGDEQSIEQSLSTFSAHMTNIVNILGGVSEGCLVLFDELGAGTDPIEGAAIAISVIEEVREYGALCAATTHYSELKEFALNTKGVVNAGCEFDVETLRPTYRLITGTPGRSNAFAISEKLGLSKRIIDRADRHIKAEDRHMEEIIAGLDEKRVELEKQASELERRRKEFDSFEREKRKYIDDLTSRTQRDAQNLREQAVRMVESAKASSAFVFDKLDKLQRQSDAERSRAELERAREDVRREIKGFSDKNVPLEMNGEDDGDYVLPRALKVGDEVLIRSLGKRGTVQSAPDKSGNVLVRAGIISTRTSIDNLRLIDDKDSKKDKKPKGAVGKQLAQSEFKMQIDLRGMVSDEAWVAVDKYIDQAMIANVHTVTLLHGKGTGALRAALWQMLKRDKRVESYRPGEYGEGDYGVTVVNIVTKL